MIILSACVLCSQPVRWQDRSDLIRPDPDWPRTQSSVRYYSVGWINLTFDNFFFLSQQLFSHSKRTCGSTGRKLPELGPSIIQGFVLSESLIHISGKNQHQDLCPRKHNNQKVSEKRNLFFFLNVNWCNQLTQTHLPVATDQPLLDKIEQIDQVDSG